VIDVRPCLYLDRSLDVSYQPVTSHPALNPLVQMLYCTISGRYPRVHAFYLDIPCLYVVPKDQSTDLVRNSTLTESHETQLIKGFEKRFPRTKELPCNLASAGLSRGHGQSEVGLQASEPRRRKI
jgi:hypothetical protein